MKTVGVKRSYGKQRWNGGDGLAEKRVLVVTGPTATGKTALGVELALALDGEVVSADSMQIYRGFDIGTAKAMPEEMRGVPHHLLDVADPSEDWSVARWVDAAAECAEALFERGKTPVIVGGTGLYIDSLLSGRDFSAVGEPALREELGAEYDRMGGEAFREALRRVDPERAEKLHPADKKRLVRAMEVYRATGEPLSVHDARTRARPKRWPSLRIALSYAERSALYARIDARVDEMFRAGLVEEVRGLLRSGVDPGGTAMQAIGYKEVAAHLLGEYSESEAAGAVCRASRRYAKRQFTWLRRDTHLHWFLWDAAPDVPGAAEAICALWRGA